MNGIPIPCRSSSAQTIPHFALPSFCLIQFYAFLHSPFIHSYKKVEGIALLKGGFLADAGDEAGGVIDSIIFLVLLSGGLIALCVHC